MTSLPAEVLLLLGTVPDTRIARQFGLTYRVVREARLERYIPRYLSPCGTRSSYRRGCRCADCCRAQADYQREWYERTVTSTSA